ncbi:MAG: proton-conducting membrane transporter [Lachnospiraceae bacterium]|nr:proton-conducting membrane transporter [Lachnospiraceae bacterium]
MSWALTDKLVLFELTDSIKIEFMADTLGLLFAVLITVVYLCNIIYSIAYMKDENNKKRYYIFYILLYFVLLSLSFSANLVTFYLFYELMTIVSVPLVFHEQTHEAVIASLKYLLYSMAGAYMVLAGIFFLRKYAITFDFILGGVLKNNSDDTAGLMLIVLTLMIAGFSVKAGMFPMHSWLTLAHPVAPSPASALLSGIIVKCGVFGILRTVFYIFGVDFIRGTWTQYLFLILSLITVFMGSLLAFREEHIKKRLAYSTISQVSYILFGIFMLDENAMTGSLLHIISHAFIKSALFMIAGILIHQTGYTKAGDFKGVGKKMPLVMWCFTICSLALTGIPPTGGFLSKWYLATGAMSSKVAVFRYLGPVILLISALLTAGYLFPVFMNGFFTDKEDKEAVGRYREGLCDPGLLFILPVMALTALSVLAGMLPGPLIPFLKELSSMMMGGMG